MPKFIKKVTLIFLTKNKSNMKKISSLLLLAWMAMYSAHLLAQTTDLALSDNSSGATTVTGATITTGPGSGWMTNGNTINNTYCTSFNGMTADNKGSSGASYHNFGDAYYDVYCKYTTPADPPSDKFAGLLVRLYIGNAAVYNTTLAGSGKTDAYFAKDVGLEVYDNSGTLIGNYGDYVYNSDGVRNAIRIKNKLNPSTQYYFRFYTVNKGAYGCDTTGDTLRGGNFAFAILPYSAASTDLKIGCGNVTNNDALSDAIDLTTYIYATLPGFEGEKIAFGPNNFRNFVGTTSAATFEASETVCGAPHYTCTPGGSVWYKFRVYESSNLTFDISTVSPFTSFDSYITIYQASSISPSITTAMAGKVVCGDDYTVTPYPCYPVPGNQSHVRLNPGDITAGNWVFIQITPENGDAGGVFMLNLSYSETTTTASISGTSLTLTPPSYSLTGGTAVTNPWNYYHYSTLYPSVGTYTYPWSGANTHLASSSTSWTFTGITGDKHLAWYSYNFTDSPNYGSTNLYFTPVAITCIKAGTTEQAYHPHHDASGDIKNSLESNANNTLTVFPDPASSILNITYSSKDQSPDHIIIYDMNGKAVKTQAVQDASGQVQLSIENLPEGNYICTTLKDGAITGKSTFTVQKK